MIAIRPPEYFPRPVYFALVDTASRFVMADTFQYSRQSYQNRARLRTPEGWQWISVPLKGGQHGLPICRTRIRPVPAWLRKHWRSLHYNYRTAPYFEFFEPELKWVFEQDWTYLGDLTCASIEVLCGVLGIATPLERATALPEQPADLAGVTGSLGGDEILSTPEAARHDQGQVSSVHVLNFELQGYRQNFSGFEPEMSILDLLFNYGPETMSMIRRAAVVTAPATSESGTET